MTSHIGTSVIGVGIAFGLSGVAGFVSVLLVGRLDTQGRERAMLVVPMLGTAAGVALFILPAGDMGRSDPGVAFGVVCLALVTVGLLEGPINISMFTLRQWRTSPSWFGRAFAISMAINAMGFPIGSAIAGIVAEESLMSAVAMGSIACVMAAAFAAWLLRRELREPVVSPS